MTTTTTRPNAGRSESAVEALILLAVAGMAGCASFTHVHDWTMHNSPVGTGDWFGWANAMVSELIPLAAGLEARRRRRLFGKAGAYPIMLIVAAAGLSLTGQFAEAKPSISGWLISAVPALGFLALVKLVLSSPTVAEDASTQTAAADSAALRANAESDNHLSDGIPREPVSAHLLASARFAANQHQHATGRPIGADELAARISITTAQAARVLHALAEENSARINGHKPLAVTG